MVIHIYNYIELYVVIIKIPFEMGSQSSVAVKCPHGNDKDLGSNPAATRNEKRTEGDFLHRRWPNGLKII